MSTRSAFRGASSAAARLALAGLVLGGCAVLGTLASPPVAAAMARPAGLPRSTGPSASFGAVSVVPGSTKAFAVGGVYASSGLSSDLIAEWTGSTWHEMTPPSPGTAVSPDLVDVWAASASDVWAVGSAQVGSDVEPQLLNWNGVSWSSVTVTGLPANSYLSGVSGTSASNIWCVGSSEVLSDGSVTSTPLELDYNGSSWRVMTAGPANSGLTEVSAASPSDVWALGTVGSSYAPMTLHYNGTSWSQVTTPAPAGTYLSGISASGTSVWAVGTAGGAAYALDWTGSKWQASKLARPAGKSAVLASVLTLSSSSVWAAGRVVNSSNTNYGAFTEQFSKGKWSLSTLPAGGNGSSILDLAGSSSSDIWGVGSYFTGKVCDSSSAPLAYHHTSSWTLSSTSALSSQAVPDC